MMVDIRNKKEKIFGEYLTPIQIFFIDPIPSLEEQILFMNYFNLMLEYFREKTDSEFMTTYKYSNNSEYTRKYINLTQVKKIFNTLPWLELNKDDKKYLKNLINNKDIKKIISFIQNKNQRRILPL